MKRPNRISILEALADRHLFGALPAFHDLSTWQAWCVFLAATYGLPLSACEAVGVSESEALRLFQHHTGRTVYDPPLGGYAETMCIVGVQSGKTRIAGTIAGYEAMMTEPELDGTDLYCVLVAQDQRSSLRSLFSYAKAPFDHVPVLAQSVVARRAETLTLPGCVLAVYPCRPQAVRGLRARVVVLDELAFYRSSEGYPTDVEMLRAARGRVATTGGKVITLSSPYSQVGALFETHRKNFARDDSPILVWQATAPEMNPSLPADYLSRMAQDDPEAYQSEALGQFRAGVSTFFDPEALNGCIETGVREVPPQNGVSYRGYTDAASGTGKDAFACAVAHVEGDVVRLDALRVWKPSFNPSVPLAESAALFTQYGIREVSGDRFAAGFVVEGYRQHAITYTGSDRDTSATYLELLPLVNAGRVRLLDIPEMLRELRGLERRRGTSGRDRIDHRTGAHDDQAVAAAGALVACSAREQSAHVVVVRARGFDGGSLCRGGEPMTLAEDRAHEERVRLLKLNAPPYETTMMVVEHDNGWTHQIYAKDFDPSRHRMA